MIVWGDYGVVNEVFVRARVRPTIALGFSMSIFLDERTSVVPTTLHPDQGIWGSLSLPERRHLMASKAWPACFLVCKKSSTMAAGAVDCGHGLCCSVLERVPVVDFPTRLPLLHDEAAPCKVPVTTHF